VPAIGLLGDVMLGRGVAQRLATQPPAEVWSPEVRAVCRSCDALIANLECCISDRGRRVRLIHSKPFFFRAPRAGVEALTAIGTSAVGLANNHALDYGPEALLDTLRHLDAAGIACAGAGADAYRARRGALLTADGLRLGLLALSDHPAEYAAGPESPGIAYAKLKSGLPDWLDGEIERLRRDADLVLVFPHWGPNMTTEPAAWQRRQARELLAAGADAVAGHSAHVFHGIELTDGQALLYDLGDALDDYAVDAMLRNDLGVLAIWRPGEDPPLELVGLELEFCRTDLARGAEADWIAARLERACAELGTRVERLAEQRFAVRA
jgi:poly-gamma-glutamate synthesis protein (capsule biosynthesis protein)